MLQLKKHQLAFYNGQDKPKIFVSYKGNIYDVTSSRHWKKGIHYSHWAGQDLTAELEDAPHHDEVFDQFPCVGILI